MISIMTNYIKDSKNDVNYTQCICDSLGYAITTNSVCTLFISYLRYWWSHWWLWLAQNLWQCWLLWKTGRWFQDGDAWRHGVYCSINWIQSGEVQPQELQDQMILCCCNWPVLRSIISYYISNTYHNTFEKKTPLNKIARKGICVEWITFFFPFFSFSFWYGYFTVILYLLSVCLSISIYLSTDKPRVIWLDQYISIFFHQNINQYN